MDVENEAMVLADTKKDLCRVCLTASQNNQCIFRTNRPDSENEASSDLLEKLRLCGGVEVVENDGLPAGVCKKCIAKLNDAHELRQQCQKADIRLRELYGKLVAKQKEVSSTRDQYCQTDYFSMGKDSGLDGKEPDPCIKEHIVQGSSIQVENNNDNSNVSQEQSPKDCDIMAHYSEMEDTCSKRKQNTFEKPTAIIEAYRTRRSTMFKRVTSMESLRNDKERQRKYIKKNVNLKRESLENDFSVIVHNTRNTVETTSTSDLTYTCPKCTRCYSTKRSLDKHILTHTERKFSCDKCNKDFFQLEKLLCHSKLHKVQEKPVQCKICKKTFRKTDTMVRHLNTHKKVNPEEVLSILKEIRDKRKSANLDTKREDIAEAIINCNEVQINEEKTNGPKGENLKPCLSDNPGNSTDEPDTEFTSMQNIMDFRSELLTVDTVHRCQHCNKCYTTEKSLLRHLLNHDEKKFVCGVCNMKFFRHDRLKSHKTRYGHDEDKTILESQKPPDDKSAIKLINTWIREELDSDNEEKGFPCKICGKSYDTKRSLLKHQISIHDTQGDECATCGKKCVCGDEGKTQIKSYRCDVCDKTFEKEIKLQRHLRIHERAKEQQDSNFKRFLCHICSKTFRQNTGLMFHMRTHTGYKPHVCKYCGRGFTSNSNCINHERTHTGDRPFVCHFCSAAFAKSCTLKAHITTHTGEANYHCKTCGKSFRRLKYLKEHKFTHTGEKPYACKLCGTAYSHSGSLFVHEKKCKAQYISYQNNATQQSAQIYCQPQISTTPVGPIIITGVPQSKLNTLVGALAVQTGKAFIDNLQRMGSQSQGVTTSSGITTSDLNVQPHVETPGASSTVKNVSLIGQIFQS